MILLRFVNFRVWLRDVTRWERVVLRVFAWQQGIRGSGLVAKALLQNMFEGTERGYQGTPGQSQTGSGAPTRNTDWLDAQMNRPPDEQMTL